MCWQAPAEGGGWLPSLWQWAAARPDIVPQDLALKLETLHMDAPTHSQVYIHTYPSRRALPAQPYASTSGFAEVRLLRVSAGRHAVAVYRLGRVLAALMLAAPANISWGCRRLRQRR